MKNIAALILAAGKGSRFGNQKLLQKLPNGQSILRYITGIVIETGITRVVIVSQPENREIREVLKDYDVSFSVNPNAHLGISTSLKTGIQSISDADDAVLVVLGDQPFISKELIYLLVNAYVHSQAEIVYPVVGTTRSNPVILDRVTFPAIMQLHGDIGARSFFHLFKNHPVNWHDSRLLMDVDSPEDLQKVFAAWNQPE